MAALPFIEVLALIAAALFAIRRARPAVPPFARRMAWIDVLLATELAVLYAFVAFQARTQWGVSTSHPAGAAFLTQALRTFLLLAAASAWLGLVRDEFGHRAQRVTIALCVFALGWSSGGARSLAAIVLVFLLHRLKWVEALNGWRRAQGLVSSALLLVLLSLIPVVTAVNGMNHLHFAFAPAVWPPPLLFGNLAPGAATELSLIRPLDRAVQALTDLLRIQLLIVTIKLLFLPIRLAGTSLKRRFTINFILVRSVPAFLTGVTFIVLAYLALGYSRLERLRAEFGHTLARAGTVAEALIADPTVRAGKPDAARWSVATRWMGDDGAAAHVETRERGQSDAAFAGDSASAAGLLVRRDSLYLVAQRSAPGGPSVEVYVPVDSMYLTRIMRPIGGDLIVRARPAMFVGSSGVRVEGDSAWARHVVTVRAPEPGSDESRPGRWFLGRSYIPVGDWSRASRGTERRAVELGLTTTEGSLIRTLFISLGGLSANIVTLGILLGFGFLFSLVEGIAVRSGRSIVQAVVDEAAALRTAAEHFGAGDLDYRLPVRGKDEFSVVSASFNQMAANLERQRGELIAAERFEEDLAVARQIQQRFLPQRTPGLEGLDVAGVSLPSREVGGDLFYWFPNEDGSLGFTLGDVSGKSVPAALLMSNVLAALRAHAQLRIELAESMGRVNRFIIDQIEPGRFVTLFYGEADPAPGTLRYASAGHNPALLLHADGRIEWLREGGVPLGVLPETVYTAVTVQFDRGDTLIVYSDGVTEAEGPMVSTPAAASDGPPLFGEERLASVVQSQRGRSAHAILDALLEAVHAFASGAPQADDITLVVVRRS